MGGIARTTRALLRCLACAGRREGNGFGWVYHTKTDEPKESRELHEACLSSYAPPSPVGCDSDQGWEGRSVSQRSYSSQGANAAWARETFSRRDFGLVVLGLVVEPRTSVASRSFGGRRLLLPCHTVYQISQLGGNVRRGSGGRRRDKLPIQAFSCSGCISTVPSRESTSDIGALKVFGTQ